MGRLVCRPVAPAVGGWTLGSAVLLLGAAVCTAGPAQAQSPLSFEDNPAVIRDTFGEVGVLDMPSGHMAPDGALSFTMGGVGVSRRYSFTVQRKNWLEGTFRYSRVAGARDDWDRSAGIKIRLVAESDLWPDISVGIRNLIGTGQYDAEYLAFSKHFGPIDLTGGLGWGRLAGNNGFTNPLGLISSSFKTRPVGTTGLGGTLRFGEYFHGQVGAFGGAIVHTPIDDLDLLVEYSPDEYTFEATRPKPIKVRSPVNVGLYYRPAEFLSLSAGWMYGTTYGLTVTITGDATSTYPNAARIGPKLPPPAIRTESQQQGAIRVLAADRPKLGLWVNTPPPNQDLRQTFLGFASGVRDIDVYGKSIVVDAHIEGDGYAQCSSFARLASLSGTRLGTLVLTDLQDPAGQVKFCSVDSSSGSTRNVEARKADDDAKVREKLNIDLAQQAINLNAVWMNTSELWLYYENYRYLHETEAVGRVIRVLMADAPPSVEIFHIVAVKLGVPMQEVTIVRSAMERGLLNHDPASALRDALSLDAPPLNSPVLASRTSELYPSFSWGVDPKVTERLFDPDQPLQWMVYADATGLLQISPGLLLSAELTGTLWTNYTFTRGAGSVLPHVRTDILQYLKRGKYGISALNLEYRGRLSSDVFGSVRAGYLEDMFMGVGAQVLWRPEGSRLSFGGDIYQVWKRDFNRLFGAQPYNVLTGHLSVYYQSPWNGINFALHAGRYLAGDYGATFQMTRRFSTGVEIGAWATFTNVPFSRFGEGSFDKGLIVRIPFEWGLPIYSQASYALELHSLTRDGGQRMAGDDSLYDATRETGYIEMMDHLDDVVAP